eukprot:TRINITY_DN122896_c0_g1_i1.p2 TRINITY_DN122896_c0_g1~~TRINITY_DN122896_c0_g1_i1.p2  ORF type:complete len:134 (+),score=19.07 TRINITY_DN122896_c0_g1_i1:83-484(+)
MLLLSAVRYGRIPREIVWSVAKGMYGRSKRCYRLALRRVMKDLDHNYYLRHRTSAKMRTKWITRINPAAREHSMCYSQFVSGLHRAQVFLDRKMLCSLAETEPVSFKCLVDESKRLAYPPGRGKYEGRDLSGF